MNPALATIIGLLVICLVGVLLTGIAAMIKGGEFNQKYGNKLMQARVIFQGAVVALLILAFMFSQK